MMTIALLETWLAAGPPDAGDDGLPADRLSPRGRPAAPIDDDQDLVRRIRDDDTHAFDTLARRHIPALVRFASALVRDRDTAEDIVQIVLARLWDRRAEFAPRGSVVAYLCAAVRNQALDQRRRADARHRATADAITGHATSTEPAAETESDAIRALRIAFFRLPEHYRAVLQLRYGRRLGYTDIAAALGQTPKGAERLLARAVSALRREMAAN